jgi:hypothetical protein
MHGTYFGLGLQFADNGSPAIAMDSVKVLTIEVEENRLLYRLGDLRDATVEWGSAVVFTTGKTPAVTFLGNAIFEVHETDDPNKAGNLWYSGGVWKSPGINWPTNEKYDTGRWPSIAINSSGVVLEVHQHPTDDRIYYRVGSISGTKIKWAHDKGTELCDGSRPRVAMNNSGNVVIAFNTINAEVKFQVGRVLADAILRGDSFTRGGGFAPAVALTEDNIAVAVYQISTIYGTTLTQMTFRVPPDDGMVTDFDEPPNGFDTGYSPCVAAYGSRAIEAHVNASGAQALLYGTSLLLQRKQWMTDALPQIGGRLLRQLCLPASHDAGMYLGGAMSAAGKTQSLTILGQAQFGSRWFDLRPKWTLAFGICIYHGITLGPALSDVIADVRTFMLANAHELVVLNLCQFDSFDQTTYSDMVKMIRDQLDTWLYKEKPDGKRLADLRLNEFVADRGRVLIVVDDDWAIKTPEPGFWVYRKCDKSDAAKSELSAFDQYSDKTEYEQMKSDQFDKFFDYNGVCEKDGSPCDLFLLSWTLTPTTGVWYYAAEPDKKLGNDIRELRIPNQFGEVVNMLYVDYVEFSRATDIAHYLMGIAPVLSADDADVIR